MNKGITLEQLVEHIDAMILKAEEELADARARDRKLMIPACEFQVDLLKKVLDVGPSTMTTSRRARVMIERLQGVVDEAKAEGDHLAVGVHQNRIDTLRQALGELPIE